MLESWRCAIAFCALSSVNARRHGSTERWRSCWRRIRGGRIQVVLVVVNTMIRVPWVLFNGSAAGKAPRESRSGLYILGEEWYNRLLESV